MARKTYPEPKQFKPRFPNKYKGTWPIVARSSWEWDFMTFIDKHPSVRMWASESIVIQYKSPVDGKTHRYFPDFYIEFVDAQGNVRAQIIEIKPFEQTIPPKHGSKASETTKRKAAETYATNQAKWEAALAVCKHKGYDFRVLTERELYGKRKR